jgi:uncharacterized membrane protein YebE (DUF533 family)
MKKTMLIIVGVAALGGVCYFAYKSLNEKSTKKSKEQRKIVFDVI